MGIPTREQSRSKTRNQNSTQFDRDLITAARDGKIVELFFTLQAVVDQHPDVKCKLEVVDRYMVKTKPVGGLDGIWIQKHHLAGVRVLG